MKVRLALQDSNHQAQKSTIIRIVDILMMDCHFWDLFGNFKFRLNKELIRLPIDFSKARACFALIATSELELTEPGGF